MGSSRARAEADRLAADLDAFACGAWPLVCPAPLIYELAQHSILLHLQAAHEGRLGDTLVINVPPGQSKSLLANVIYPAWVWARDPRACVIAVSHTAGLVTRFAAKFRILIESDWYRARWPRVSICRDTRAKLSMRTTALGERIGVSAGGSITGSHADYIVVDDLVDARDANNINVIRARNEWHEEVLMSRWKDERAKLEVCIAQRLHTCDLPALLMARGAVALVLPAERPGPPNAIWTDPRQPTELLAPVRLPRAVLASKKRILGAFGYAAQYDQAPVPAEGGVVSREWLAHEYEPADLPQARQVFLVADTSHGEHADNDPTGALVVARSGATLFALDYLTGVWQFPEQLVQIKRLIVKWRPHMVYVEAAASGRSITQTLRQQLANVVGVPPHGPKGTRLSAITPALESGAFRFPAGAPWVPAFRAEVLAFPKAPHDECVDVLSLACSKLLTRPGVGATTAEGVQALIEAMS